MLKSSMSGVSPGAWTWRCTWWVHNERCMVKHIYLINNIYKQYNYSYLQSKFLVAEPQIHPVSSSSAFFVSDPRLWVVLPYKTLRLPVNQTNTITLKQLNQVKIVKKSVILFLLLNMTIWCEHVHRLELQMYFIFCAAHLPVKRVIETKSPYFLFWTC